MIELKTKMLVLVLIAILGLSIGYSALNSELFISGDGAIFVSRGLLSDLIIEEAGGKDYIESKKEPDFNVIATTNEGMYATADDYGISYYYRGQVDNNYVYFGGYYWRIIRINGNGSIRLIYQGKTADATGTFSSIDESMAPFNMITLDDRDNAYVGYMYGTPKSLSYKETHANIHDSTIKQIIDDWYIENLLEYEDYLDKTVGFCGDRSIENGTGIGLDSTYYAANKRVIAYVDKTPTLKCPNQNNDLYTVSSSSYGNNALTYPIALITADEISFAGGLQSYPLTDTSDYNTYFYLYSNSDYWTMTPVDTSGYSVISLLGLSGHLTQTGSVANSHIRPVINLKSDVIATGMGTKNNPYRIVD